MKIRLLHECDAEVYRVIRLEALKNHPEAFSSSYEQEHVRPIEQFRERFRNEGAYTFGAFDHEALVGIVTLVRESYDKLRHRANIVGMYVKSEKRGQGIGKLLVNTALHRARQIEGLEQVYLSVISSNVSAKKLYLTCGFQVFGTEKNALKLGENNYFDEDHMVIFL